MAGARTRLQRFLVSRGMSLMPSDDATGCGAQQAVVAGIMAGDATDQRPLDASLGLRR